MRSRQLSCLPHVLGQVLNRWTAGLIVSFNQLCAACDVSDLPEQRSAQVIILAMTEITTIDLTRTICQTSTPPTIYPGHPPLHIKSEATIEKDGWSVHSVHFGTHTATHIDAPCHFIEGGRSIDQIGLEELVGLKALVIDMSTVGVQPRQKIRWEDLEEAWASTVIDIGDSGSAVNSLTTPKATTTGTERRVSLSNMVDSGDYSMLLVHTGWPHTYDQSPANGSKSKVAFFDHPYFAADVAARLASRSSSIRLFGSDTPNPDETPFNGVGGADGHVFHRTFLGANGVIAENLTNLDHLARQEGLHGAGGWRVSIVPMKIKNVDGAPVRAFARRERRGRDTNGSQRRGNGN